MGDGEGEELWMGGYAWPPTSRAPARGSLKGGQTIAAKCRHVRKLTRKRGCVHAQADCRPASKISFLHEQALYSPYIELTDGEKIYGF